LKMGERQRFAPRRIFWRLLDWRRFGTAMVLWWWFRVDP
jgi:hypothetical protein